MNWLRRLLNTLRSERTSQALDDELRFHLDMRVERNMARGMNREEAVREAERKFGNVTAQKESARDSDVVEWFDGLLQDLRYAFRQMRKTPVLASVVVLSLALGIGANTAIFSIANALLLREMPGAFADRLYSVTPGRNGSLTNPLWEEIRKRQDVFDSMFAYGQEQFNTATMGESSLVHGAYVSPGLLETLGLEPHIGRSFSPSDDVPGKSDPVAMISHAFWKRTYGGDPSVLGRSIRLGGRPFLIVGVLPEPLAGLEPGQFLDVVVPIAAEPLMRGKESGLKHRSYWWLQVIGRLKSGLTETQARERMRLISPGVMEETLPERWVPDDLKQYRNQRLEIASAARGLSYLRSQMQTPVLVLQVVVALVLLIASANVANLLLARAAVREREFATRVALGASRSKIARQILVESTVLALCGGALGLLLAPIAANAFVAASSTQNERLQLDIAPDGAVLAFTFAVSMLCSLLFGAAPLVRALHTVPQTGLRSASGAAGGRGQVFRRALVGAQVAMSVILLAGAGLLLMTLHNIMNVDLGFDARNVLRASVDLSRSGIDSKLRAEKVLEVVDRLRGMPGIESAAATHVMPVTGSVWNTDYEVEGENGNWTKVGAHVHSISSGFFGTARTRILRGRDFGSSDRPGGTHVAVVNESFAKAAFAGRSPLGRRIREVGPPGFTWTDGPVEIVGVVQDARYRSLREPAPSTVYLPMSQAKEFAPFLSFAVRCAGPCTAAKSSIRTAMAEWMPKAEYKTTEYYLHIRDAMLTERLLASLCALFGAIAALLSSLGLYGILSYTLAQRRGEIGIRMALGASAYHLKRWVFRYGMAPVALGCAAGLMISRWAAALIQAQLFGIDASDWRVPALALAAMALVALIAVAIPALRSARVNPAEILRHE